METSFWERIRSQPIYTKKDTIIPYPSEPSTTISEPYKCRLLNVNDIKSITRLLYTEFHYAYLSKTPDMVISPQWLLRDLSGGAYGIGCWVGAQLIGCVWARPIGNIHRNNSKSIIIHTYIVENLCISSQFRGKGLTRILLNWLEVNRPRATVRFIFLKEGKSVPTNYISWDNYVFTRITGKMLDRIRRVKQDSIYNHNECRKITLEEALVWRENICKDKDILWNTPDKLSRTQLWLWKDKALMAITETHQIHPLDDQPIGLITGWIYKNTLSTMERSEAQIDIFREQPYTWLWSARSMAEEYSAQWFKDGLVWWQPYLWTAPTDPAKLFLIL
jgi:hypothetical protein